MSFYFFNNPYYCFLDTNFLLLSNGHDFFTLALKKGGGRYVPSVEGACNFSRNVVLLCLCFDSMKTLLLGRAVPSCQQSLRVPVQKPAVDGEWTKPKQYISHFANTEHFVWQIFKR